MPFSLYLLMRCNWVRLGVGALLAVVTPISGHAAEVRIAVAANFTEAAKEIGTLFETASGHTVVFSFGSTGQLFAQIAQGAPFDIFLAADQTRPERAVRDGYGVAGTRFTYATGRIVLYSADPTLVQGAKTLEQAYFTKLAIANPVTAPYGAAAVETLQALGVYEAVEGKIVQGMNIAQAYQFVATGNAELGFVALSQVARNHEGSRWQVPEALHSVIAQDAVLLSRGAANEAARAFLTFLKGPVALTAKEKFGYRAGDSP